MDQPRIRLVRSESGMHCLREFLSLTKPRVVALIVFTAVIGMFLAPGAVPLAKALFGALGIALVAAVAAATNCLLEAKRDAVMAAPVPRVHLASIPTCGKSCEANTLHKPLDMP